MGRVKWLPQIHMLCCSTRPDDVVNEHSNAATGRGPSDESANAMLCARQQSVSNRICSQHKPRTDRDHTPLCILTLYITLDWQRQTELAFGMETSVLIPLSRMESCWCTVVK